MSFTRLRSSAGSSAWIAGVKNDTIFGFHLKVGDRNYAICSPKIISLAAWGLLTILE